MFRLLIGFVLLSGGFILQSPSQCLVSAQGGKENDKNNNKDKDKNNNKDKDKNNNKNKEDTLAPSAAPTMRPTTPYPTQSPSSSPTKFPTSSPTKEAVEASLPEIKIDITTVVDDVFTFAALLLDADDSEINDTDDLNNRDLLNAYFESFIEDLLIAGEIVPSSALYSVDVEVKFLPLDNEEASSSVTTPTTKTVSNGTPVRIAIQGKMTYALEVDGETGDDIDRNSDGMLLEDKMSHTLAVYFGFWSTDEMLSKLSEFGLTDPRITAVRVDDELILVAANPNPPNNGYINGDNIGDNSNLLVPPTDSADDIESFDFTSITAGGSALGRTGPFFVLAATAGSTIALLLQSIIA